MLLKRCSWVFVAGLIASASDGIANAEDRDLAFVHALQARHYGDTAVEFLNSVKDNPAIKDVWDLEMAESLRRQAESINDPALRKTKLDEATQHLNQFAKEKPNHPKALQAQLTNAGSMIDQGIEAIAAARLIQEPAEKKAKLAEARKQFEDARPMLKKGEGNVLDRLKDAKDRYKKLGPEPASLKQANKKQREAINEIYGLRVDVLNARSRIALVDYYISQTYQTKDEDGKRREALNKAAEILDNYFQEYRAADPASPEARFDFWVHAWHGKVDEDLGGLDEAKEIYDEVLQNFQDLKENKSNVFPMEVAAPRGPVKYQPTDIDDILARTKHFSMMLFLKQHPKRESEYLSMARDFVETEEYKKNLKQEWGYQAAAFELAKHLIAAAEKAEKDNKAADKNKLTREALGIIKDLAAVRGEFQREAIELRKKISTGAPDTAQTVDEALQNADIAIDGKQWEDATTWLKKALDLEEAKGSKKDPGQISQIQERIANIAMLPISQDFEEAKKKGEFPKEKWAAWYDGVLKVVANHKKTLVAQKAMDFALDCAEQLHRIAVQDEKEAKGNRDKDAVTKAAAAREVALARLKEAAALAHTNYPGSGEDDKGRMGLARVSAMDGKYVDALAVYESIKPASDKYPEALDMLGRIYDTLYLTEKDKKEADRDANKLEGYRVKAVAALGKSIEAAKSKHKSGDDYPTGLLETQNVLAQIHLDAKEFKEAAAVVDPLVTMLAAQHPKQLDKTMLAIFGDSVRADLGLNDFKKAGEHGTILIDLGEDIPAINAVLVNFVLRLDTERKKIQDALNSLPDSTPPAERDKIVANLTSIKTMLAEMLTKLSSRKQMNPQTLVYIGNIFDAIEMPDEAEQQYRSVLQRRDSDPEFVKDKDNVRLLNAVRAKQVSLLNKRGKYQEAVSEADKLIKEFPDALDPLVERAKIYQDWAKKDYTKYDNAISSWTEIRLRLERTVKQKEPPGGAAKDRYVAMRQSYFDAIYNTSFCLLTQAKRLQANDKAAAMQKAKIGEQVLTSAFNAFPKLDGTEATQKKFAAIKAQLAAFRGPAPTTAASGA